MSHNLQPKTKNKFFYFRPKKRYEASDMEVFIIPGICIHHCVVLGGFFRCVIGLCPSIFGIVPYYPPWIEDRQIGFQLLQFFPWKLIPSYGELIVKKEKKKEKEKERKKKEEKKREKEKEKKRKREKKKKRKKEKKRTRKKKKKAKSKNRIEKGEEKREGKEKRRKREKRKGEKN